MRFSRLEIAQLAADAGVLREVAAVAGHRLRVAGERLLLLAHLTGEPDDGPVGLELRERGLEDLARPRTAELVDEVHGHVVRRPEARVERVRAPRGERRDLLRVDAFGPLDDRVALDVDASAPCPAGELRVLPRRDRHARLAVELLELLEHDRARGHVDAERQRLGREDDLDQLALEEVLDDLLERRQQTGVMRGDAALEVVEPLVVAEHREILVQQRPGALLDDRADLRALLRAGQPHARTTHLLHGRVAAHAAEDEEDRRQQVRPLQQLDDIGAVQPLDPLHVRRAHRPLAALVRAPTGALVTAAAFVAPAALSRIAAHRLRAPVVLEVRTLEGPDAHELLVDLRGRDAGAVVEERQQVAAHEHVLLERHRADLRDDHLGVAADRVEPVAELLRVGDGRAQRDQTHRRRQVDDDLLPHRTAEAVGEVVHLVHHDVLSPRSAAGVGVEHVAQDLGGHHHDAGVAVDVRVAGQQAHLIGAVHVLQLAELLVRQRLDRGRVERLVGMPVIRCLAHREVDGELPHDRLAGTCRRRHQDAAAVFERVASGDLERVELETLGCREGRGDRMAAILRCARIALGRTRLGHRPRSVTRRVRVGGSPPPAWRDACRTASTDPLRRRRARRAFPRASAC